MGLRKKKGLSGGCAITPFILFLSFVDGADAPKDAKEVQAADPYNAIDNPAQPAHAAEQEGDRKSVV